MQASWRLLSCLFALAWLVACAFPSEAAEPTATLELTGGTVAAGVGFSWGSGTLTFRGKAYPVSVSGLSVGDVGIARATARGNVYGLRKIQDFDGIYTAYAVGSTIGGGGSVASLRNQNDVVIRIVATTQGLRLTLSASGVQMKIEAPAAQ
ncbi:MAG TPA: hypothetical protein DEP35_19855 [Deltaproteobacteria bacterium]|jgi:hypothetical protein|nr:hypothetical protein [Deltaproteobacteria bacterium]